MAPKKPPGPIRVVGKTETTLRLSVKAVFDRFRLKVAAQVMNRTMPEALLQQFAAALKKDMTPILRDEFVRTFTDIQRKTDTARIFAGSDTPKLLAERWSETDLPKRTFIPIQNVTREVIQDGITELLRNPQLQDYAATLVQLDRAFNDSRAVRIAVTETTRARTGATKGFQTTLSKLGYGYLTFWTTKVTDVCPICKPLDGTLFKFGEGLYGEGPPIHPWCRCKLLIEEDPARPDPLKPSTGKLPKPPKAPKVPKPPPPVGPPKVKRPAEMNAAQLLVEMKKLANTPDGIELVEVSRQVRQFQETDKAMRHSPPRKKKTDQVVTLPDGTTGLLSRFEYQKRAQIFLDNWRIALAEQERLIAKLNAAAHALLKVDDPITITVFGAVFLTPKGATGVHFVESIMSKTQPLSAFRAGQRPLPTADGAKDVWFRQKRLPSNGRANQKENQIFTTLFDDEGTTVHEIGHLLDEQLLALVPKNNPKMINALLPNPVPQADTIEIEMGIASRQHMLDRTTARLTKFKKTYIGTWRPGEVYRETSDEFKMVDLYAQKDYVAEFGQSMRKASEVLSTGVEFLYRNPIALAEMDPTLFEYTITVLRGQK